MLKNVIVILIIGFILFGCDASTETHSKGLIVVIENNDILGVDLSAYYSSVKNDIDSIFSTTFNVPISEFSDLSLDEIIDIYGEAWQINEISSIADNYYDEIYILSDDDATYDNFINYISQLSDTEYIDIIFNLHGNSDCVGFFNEVVQIDDLINDLNSLQQKIRTVYQTCCFGSGMIDEWEAFGVSAVNGAVGYNSYAMYSPIIFIDSFTSGLNFSEAVAAAYEYEINILEGYSLEYTYISDAFLTEAIKSSSYQLIGGSSPEISFK